MISRSLGHRAPLLWLALPMMAGLSAGKAADVSASVAWLVAALAFGAGALAVSWRAPRRFEMLVVPAMFCAGVASFALNRPHLEEWDRLPVREAEVTARIDRVFASSVETRTAGMGRIVEAAEPLRELAGQRIYFSLSLRRGEVAPIPSAIVRLRGLISPLPPAPGAGTFDGYLVNAGVNFRLARAYVLGTTRPPSAYRRFCDRGLALLSRILGAGVEARQQKLVGVYRAMLLGQQHELTADQKTLYRETGTMHVFSISGLHIAAIAAGLHALLSALRLPRPVEFPLGLIALWLYVDISGAAPSAVRAFVMVALVQASLVLRTPRNPISALVASALVVLVFAPLQLFSASFQMSYGIVAALLLLGLPLAAAWDERLPLFRDLPAATWAWHHRFRSFVWRASLGVAAIGIAASLVSAITGITFFELFTPGSFVVNLWLIPVSTFVIFFGFVSLVCGLGGFMAGSILANHAAVLVLWVLERSVEWAVGLPGVWFNASFRLPWLGAAALAALLAALIAGYATGWRGWNRGFWTPFAIVALTLAAGVSYT